MNERPQAAGFQADCRDIAGRLKQRALLRAAAISAATAAALAAIILFPGTRPLPTAVFALVGLAGAFATMALSALLLFDAALFTLMACYPDERSAGAAVDEFLARARLKPLPATARPLADRIAGARRLARRQGIAISLSAIVAILAMVANFA